MQSETRVLMTLLTIAKTRFEFQQVSTPLTSAEEAQSSEPQHRKEDFLLLPEDQGKLLRSKKTITGRSIYIGERDAFLKHIATTYTGLEGQLVPAE